MTLQVVPDVVDLEGQITVFVLANCDGMESTVGSEKSICRSASGGSTSSLSIGTRWSQTRIRCDTMVLTSRTAMKT